MKEENLDSCYESIYFLQYKNIDKNKEVDEKISKVLYRAVKDIKKISRKHRDAGIGDTQTDEEISNVFYHILHYG
jgi:hypothetical protein